MAHINDLLKFCNTPKNIFFADLTKKIDVILIHSHWTTTVVLASVFFFLFDNLKEKRSGPLAKQSGIACFKNSCGTPVENC